MSTSGHLRYPMTVGGIEKLRAELQHLKSVERPRISQMIGEARAHGDLKENAEYHAAREKQSFLEGRIQELEHKLSHVQVIDIATIPNNGRVIFGVTVVLQNLDTDERSTWQIVGEDEADIQQRKLSVTAPLARAIIGKSVGDEVDVNSGPGIVSYAIQSVEHLS